MEVDDAGLAALCASLDADVAATVAGLALPSVRMQPADACDADAAVTRFEGVPLVGEDFAWPTTDDGRPLTLIGQWHCDELNRWIGAAVLPAGRLLCFFFDLQKQAGWGLVPQDAQLWQVTVTDAATASPAEPPAGVVTVPARSVAGLRVLTMPQSSEPAIEAIWAWASPASLRYEELWLEEGPDRKHRAFGWPNLQQGSMHLDCQMVTNGIELTRQGYRDPRVPGLQAGAAGWRLLWQVDTDEHGLGWMWGDMGMLYFWIRSEDLAAGRFDRVWVILQG
ncbi:YwqG family protein [Dactylosporangium cerinum]|uniref:YwqG family protein n=1 Tax=Dactylosporangium cerinum TaxID=1434730 RepID=A0ABV9VZJ1_9ACTN